MKLFNNRSIFVSLCLTFGIGQLSYAIYDPSITTIKPPKHRESVVPWYLTGEDIQPPVDLSRSAKWNRPEDPRPPRRPVTVNAGTETWSSWRKPVANSEIGQRSESEQSEGFQQNQDLEQGFEQSQGIEQNENFEQNQNFAQNQGYEAQYQNQYENAGYAGSNSGTRGNPTSANTRYYENVEDEDSYIKIAVENKKPHREKIITVAKPNQSTRVAKFNTASRVNCPDPGATGQFVYPPDCKFFVNCWKGRAFVQPCSPGTLFNPESLECDFPHKVNCYGGELADFVSPDNLSSLSRGELLYSQAQIVHETVKLKEPKCPPEITGLLPHPSDCTKFLQCANGGTFIMDCGPGTVFNPVISVCDWPYNVKGCGDARRVAEDSPNIPVPADLDVVESENYDGSSTLPFRSVEKIECPSGHSGLLPHPTDCKKFLQCTNGITYVTDCGPGTVFNPKTTICDWPYNVEGCGKGESASNTSSQSHGTTGGQWTGNSQGQNSWQQNSQGQGGQLGNSGHDAWIGGSHGQSGQSGQQAQTVPSQAARPNQGAYGQSGQTYFSHVQTQGQTGGRGHDGQTGQSQYDPSNQQGRYDANSHGYYDQNGQYHERREGQQQGQQQNGHSVTSWSHHQETGGGSDHISGHQWGYHHRHDQDRTATGGEGSQISGQQLGHDHSYHHHHDKPIGQSAHSHSYHHDHGNVNTGEETEESNGQSTGQWQHSGVHHHHQQNHDQSGDGREGVYQGQNANGQGSYNRQGYGRTDSSFTTQTGSYGQTESNQNVYVDSSYKLPGEIDSSGRTRTDTPPTSDHTQTSPSGTRGQSGQNLGQNWNQPETHVARPGIFRPSTWSGQGQQGQETPTSSEGSHVWNQGGYEVTNRTQQKTMLGLNVHSQNNAYFNELTNENRTISTETNGKTQFDSSDVGSQTIHTHRNSNTTNSMFNYSTHSVENMSVNSNHRFSNGSSNAHFQSNANRNINLGTDEGSYSSGTSSTHGEINSDIGYGKEYWAATEGGTIIAGANGNISAGGFQGINLEQGGENIILNFRKNVRGMNTTNAVRHETKIASMHGTNVKTGGVKNQRGEGGIFDSEHNNTISGTGTIIQDTKLDEWSTNVHGQGRKDERLDSKLDRWAAKTNLFDQAKKQTGTKSKWVKWGNTDIYFPPDNLDEIINRNSEQSGADHNLHSTSVKTVAQKDHKNQGVYPSGIYVNQNGLKGHYITKEIEINQGHSNTRKYGNEDPSATDTLDRKNYNDSYGDIPPTIYEQEASTKKHTENSNSDDLIAVESNYGKTFLQNSSDRSVDDYSKQNFTIDEIYVRFGNEEDTTEKSNVHQNSEEDMTETYGFTTDPNIPTVSIEYEDEEDGKIDETATKNTTWDPDSLVEAESDTFYVDLLDKKESLKPKLVFKNRTKEIKNTVVMGINRDKIDIDIFDVEIIQEEEEPPFPVYYIPAVQPLSNSFKPALLTPISGQILRLRGGSSPREGYLEVQGAQSGWGVVCDARNSWMLKEAAVVCRQLGYSRGAEMAWQGRSDESTAPTWIAADSVDCTGNETMFQSCKFTHGAGCITDRDAVGIKCLSNRVAHCRQDEVAHQGHCYHLADPDTGLNHAEALDYCSSRKAQLLDVINQHENNFISEWLVQGYPEVGSVMTSGVGFTTFNRTVWLWEDSNRAKFRFNKWWPGWMEDKKQPPSIGSRPVCVVMKRNFPCHNRPDRNCATDYFFWDVEDCATSMKGHSYICKRPFDDIGCVYGKGQQYSGTANVTATGKECLPWDHEYVTHPLAVKVVSAETREKLQGHNYCRNPNSNRESTPWCFTGPYGEFEHCDIPPCIKPGTKKSLAAGRCKPKHFECTPGECIPSPWICDGDEDCTNGADESACSQHLDDFTKKEKHRLDGFDVEKWLNTPVKTCALRCKEADFTCRSFSHKADGNVCLLSDSNVGLTGSLEESEDFDYYEMAERTINCNGMYVCDNKKCINQTKVCDGKNNCGDRSDEYICTVDNLGYEIRLAGSESTNEGRVEVKVLGQWGQVCDDSFGMIAAGVVCKELGFDLGAVQVRPGAFYGNLEPPSLFLVDQLKCRGNETSLRECDFDGWGVHDCQPEEAVGVVCKTAVDNCQDGYWKCDNSPECIPTPFICDEVEDCADRSDEAPEHCDAPFELRLAGGSSPMEGRVEVRHHGVWGTVCDDDFPKTAATVICRSLGYGGSALAKKNGAFGPGEGPIWLDQVFCHGNETQLYRCDHNQWGKHNCAHDEDAGVVCTEGSVIPPELWEEPVPEVPDVNTNYLLPTDCGQRAEDFTEDDEYMARVVRGSIAPKGAYPWQASIRVRGHSKSNHWCGAVIISPLHVLTAAHCLEGYNKGMYFVRAGDHNTEIDEGTELEANIEDYYIHEHFRKGQHMNNDIALVLLKGRGIPLGRNIMPICLPPENTEYLPGLNCTISGWGSTESGKSVQSRDLRYGWIPLLDQSVCRAGYVYGEGAISDGMVCAGHLDEGVDACDGDSGGPMACYHNGAFTLYGITSWGQNCGRVNKPGVYVRIAHYRPWIERKLKESLTGN